MKPDGSVVLANGVTQISNAKDSVIYSAGGVEISNPINVTVYNADYVDSGNRKVEKLTTSKIF